MITYGFSIQGKGHIQRGVVCQDSSIAERIRSGHYAGIVADGVGSAKYADIGSGIAVKSLLQYCNEHIQKGSSTDHIEDILADGYDFAFRQIESEAARRGAAIQDFDTTLSAVIYSSQTVVYGHAGDGGIIAKYTDGKIEPLSSRQKGEDATSVIPLRAGRSSWVFGTEENVAAVLLATDGMLDDVLQPLLLNLPPGRMALARGNFRRNHVYVTAAEFFMNPDSVYRNRSVKDPDKYMRTFLEGELDGADEKPFLQCVYIAYMKQLGKQGTDRIMERMKKYLYAVKAVSEVTDDKSVVCIMDEKVSVKAQDTGYYEEPEWEMLRKKYEELLYGKLPEPPEELPGGSGDGGGDPFPPEPPEKDLWSGIREKLPAVLISLVVGCVLGSTITFILMSGFRRLSDADRVTKQPAARRETMEQLETEQPESGTKKSADSKTKSPNGGTARSNTEKLNTEQPESGTEKPPTPGAGSSADAADFQKDAKKLLECLLKLNGLKLSESDKKRVQEAIDEYGFSKYMNIPKAETNNSSDNFDKSDTADAKTVDGLVKELISVIEKIGQETANNDQTENFKSELKKMYDKCKPEDQKKISFVSQELKLIS